MRILLPTYWYLIIEYIDDSLKVESTIIPSNVGSCIDPPKTLQPHSALYLFHGQMQTNQNIQWRINCKEHSHCLAKPPSKFHHCILEDSEHVSLSFVLHGSKKLWCLQRPCPESNDLMDSHWLPIKLKCVQWWLQSDLSSASDSFDQ